MRAPRETLATLFERAPSFVDRLAQEEAANWDDLFEHAEEIARNMPLPEQVELLNSHPRIGALPTTVSALSYREQGYNRDRGPDGLHQRLQRLNDDYEARFGFRFVVFVNGRSREDMADMLTGRLQANRADELDRGLSDVIAIARDRQRKMEAEWAR